MNASGRPNTCKSRGSEAEACFAYVTCLILEDNPEKFGLILHMLIEGIFDK